LTKCPHCSKEQRIEETRLRSLAKAITSKLGEVFLDMTIIGSILSWVGIPPLESFAYGATIGLILEIICAFVNYWNDRLWNRISWGRKATKIEEDKVKSL